MSYQESKYTTYTVYEGCGHNVPRSFDSYTEAYRYASEASKKPHYLSNTTPVQLVVKEVRETVRTFKNGEF